MEFFSAFCANFSSKLNSSPRLRGATGFLRFFSVLLILNFLVFCANVHRNQIRLRVSAVQLVFSGFSPCLSASVVGFGFSQSLMLQPHLAGVACFFRNSPTREYASIWFSTLEKPWPSFS